MAFALPDTILLLKELPYGFVSQRIAFSGDRSIRGDDVQLIQEEDGGTGSRSLKELFDTISALSDRVLPSLGTASYHD